MRNTFPETALFARRGLVILACVLLPLYASAQTARPGGEFEREATVRLGAEAQRLFGTDEAMDVTVARAYGTRISPAHVEVARKLLRRVLLHEGFHRYLVQLVLPIAGAETTQAQIRSAMLEGIGALQAKGMMRMSAERQEDFAHHTLGMARVLPPEVCKGVFLSQVTPAEANMLERAYIASLPLAAFEHIITLYTDASIAELEQYPASRTLSSEQGALANQAHRQAMLRKISALDPEAVARVIRDRQGAPAREACAFYTAVFESMVDLPQPYRTWRILEFVRDMQ